MKSRQAKKLVTMLGHKEIRISTAVNALVTIWQRTRFKDGDSAGHRMMKVSSRKAKLMYARMFNNMARKCS